MKNEKFEELVLDLYKKQVSGDYVKDNKFSFTGAVTLWNSSIYFNEIRDGQVEGLEFLTEYLSEVENLHIYSSSNNDLIISKAFFKDYVFNDDATSLEISTSQKNYSFTLKE